MNPLGSSVKDVRSKGTIHSEGLRSTTQHHTKACHAGVQLHTDSYHPYSDGSDCTKRTTQVARRLPSVAPWPVASVRGESATSHPSLATHWPMHCFPMLLLQSDTNDRLPVLCNLFNWMQSAFVKTD